jgi:hypothetical protein
MARTSANSDASNGKPRNKSDAIRQAVTANPNAKSKEIMSLLASQGIKVAPTLVYYVKSRMKHAKRMAKRTRVAEASRNTASGNPVDLVLGVKDLAHRAGGMASLKRLVDAMAE